MNETILENIICPHCRNNTFILRKQKRYYCAKCNTFTIDKNTYLKSETMKNKIENFIVFCIRCFPTVLFVLIMFLLYGTLYNEGII